MTRRVIVTDASGIVVEHRKMEVRDFKDPMNYQEFQRMQNEAFEKHQETIQHKKEHEKYMNALSSNRTELVKIYNKIHKLKFNDSKKRRATLLEIAEYIVEVDEELEKHI
jgi:hypothetical protein